MMAASNGGAQRRPAFVAGTQAQARTPEQRSADLIAAQEFHRIAKFAAACRRQWPGAKIVLRPNQDGAAAGASAPPNQNPHQEDLMMDREFDEHALTPTEADLTSCYGSKYLSAEEVGNRKIRSKIAKVWMDRITTAKREEPETILAGLYDRRQGIGPQHDQ